MAAAEHESDTEFTKDVVRSSEKIDRVMNCTTLCLMLAYIVNWRPSH